MCLNVIMVYPQISRSFITHILYFGSHFEGKQYKKIRNSWVKSMTNTKWRSIMDTHKWYVRYLITRSLMGLVVSNPHILLSAYNYLFFYIISSIIILSEFYFSIFVKNQFIKIKLLVKEILIIE